MVDLQIVGQGQEVQFLQRRQPIYEYNHGNI